MGSQYSCEQAICYLSGSQVNGVDLTHASRVEALTVLKEAGEHCAMVISREDLWSELSPTTNGISGRRYTSVRKRISKGTSKVQNSLCSHTFLLPKHILRMRMFLS